MLHMQSSAIARKHILPVIILLATSSALVPALWSSRFRPYNSRALRLNSFGPSRGEAEGKEGPVHTVRVGPLPVWLQNWRQLVGPGPWERAEGPTEAGTPPYYFVEASLRRPAACDVAARLRGVGLGGSALTLTSSPALPRGPVRLARTEDAKRRRDTSRGFERQEARWKNDPEARFSLTPEALALRLAERVATGWYGSSEGSLGGDAAVSVGLSAGAPRNGSRARVGRPCPPAVVDLTCGAGGNAIAFARAGCSPVVAVDVDAGRLELARHNARVYGVGTAAATLGTAASKEKKRKGAATEPARGERSRPASLCFLQGDSVKLLRNALRPQPPGKPRTNLEGSSVARCEAPCADPPRRANSRTGGAFSELAVALHAARRQGGALEGKRGNQGASGAASAPAATVLFIDPPWGEDWNRTVTSLGDLPLLFDLLAVLVAAEDSTGGGAEGSSKQQEGAGGGMAARGGAGEGSKRGSSSAPPKAPAPPLDVHRVLAKVPPSFDPASVMRSFTKGAAVKGSRDGGSRGDASGCGTTGIAADLHQARGGICSCAAEAWFGDAPGDKHRVKFLLLDIQLEKN